MKLPRRVKFLTTGLLSVGLVVVACQRPTDSRQKVDPERESVAAVAPAGGADRSGGDLRLDANRVVLTWSGGQLTYGELHKKRQASFDKLYAKYMSDLYAAEQQELEGFVVQTLVEEAAKKAGTTPEAYVQGLAGMPEVSDAEVQDFYDKNVKQSGQALDAIRDQIRSYLVNQKKQEKVRREFERLKGEAKVKIDLPPPEVSVANFDLAGRPMKGNPSAKVTVVEFSDFECPYCSRATAGVDELLKAYPNDVKIYFLHFPLSFHKSALPAAIASHCAHKQEKFWAFHDKLFGNQRGLDADFFKASAKELGLDESKFLACLEDPASRDVVNRDLEQGNAAGVEGTPSFFINGSQYSQGVPTVEALKPYVERASAN